MTVNVVLTRLASTTTAGLPVKMPADRTLSVKPGTMELSAPVLRDLWETLSLPVGSLGDIRPMLSDSQDSVAMLILIFFCSQKFNDKSKV